MPINEEAITQAYEQLTTKFTDTELDQLAVLLSQKWVDCPDTKGRFEISDLGNVRSKKSKKIYKPLPSSNGYLHLRLHTESSKATETIFLHRAVAKAFFTNPDPDTLDTVDHINSVKTDNRACNLQFLSRADNVRKAWKDGLYAHINDKKKKAVAQLKDGVTVAVYDSVAAAARAVGGARTTIGFACKNGVERLGYYWQFN